MSCVYPLTSLAHRSFFDPCQPRLAGGSARLSRLQAVTRATQLVARSSRATHTNLYTTSHPSEISFKVEVSRDITIVSLHRELDGSHRWMSASVHAASWRSLKMIGVRPSIGTSGACVGDASPHAIRGPHRGPRATAVCSSAIAVMMGSSPFTRAQVRRCRQLRPKTLRLRRACHLRAGRGTSSRRLGGVRRPHRDRDRTGRRRRCPHRRSAAKQLLQRLRLSCPRRRRRPRRLPRPLPARLIPGVSMLAPSTSVSCFRSLASN